MPGASSRSTIGWRMGRNKPALDRHHQRIAGKLLALHGDNARPDGVHAPQHLEAVLDGDKTLRGNLLRAQVAGEIGPLQFEICSSSCSLWTSRATIIRPRSSAYYS